MGAVRRSGFLDGSVALIVVLVAMRVWVCWGNDAHVGFTDGINIALAADLRDGLFYPPLYGPDGYGATYYFPLYFVLHALLLKLGFPVLLSAYLLSAAAVVLLILGTFYLMRDLGVQRWLAACSAGALLAAGSVQWSLLSPHADGMACALNVWGLAVTARPQPSARKILLASVLFTLAWSAKLTAVYGLAAAFFWLASTGFMRLAWTLAVETTFGYLLVAGAMIFGSQGRVLETFLVTSRANASTMSLRQIMIGPWHMLRLASRGDPALILFLLLAVLVLMLLPFSKTIFCNLPALFFISTVAVMAVIFSYPANGTNHCLDVHVAAVLLITSWLAKGSLHYKSTWGICGFALAILVTAIPTLRDLKTGDQRFRPHRFQRAIAFIGDVHKPILSENAVVPVLAGQHPYVVDPYPLALIREHLPNFTEPLLDGLRHQDFGAVVLPIDPGTNYGRYIYENALFGPGFIRVLLDEYRLASTIDGQMIYLPKS